MSAATGATSAFADSMAGGRQANIRSKIANPCVAPGPERARIPLAGVETQTFATMKNQITRWSPFKGLDQLQNPLASVWQFDPFGDVGMGEPVTTAELSPSVDMSEDAREYLIKAELPDMRKEDVKVSVEDGILTVSGERRFEKQEKGKKNPRIERVYGSFARSFTLPAGTAGKKVSAQFKNGVLRVHLPKDRPALSGRAIEIKAG
jgi:HSP20 family protein